MTDSSRPSSGPVPGRGPAVQRHCVTRCCTLLRNLFFRFMELRNSLIMEHSGLQHIGNDTYG